MKILMCTNTYLPHVGGVARSVDTFCRIYRAKGHEVLVLAPQFEGAPAEEEGVVRLPALQKFNGSDFSVRLPIPSFLLPKLEAFTPDVVHSHHPFLVGDTAVRIGAKFNVPVIFTHHTMYEQYTHYVPGDSPAVKKIVSRLATEYSNLCDHVIAPSESIRDILVKRGVTVPVTVIPTGVDTQAHAQGDRDSLRHQLKLSADTFIVGHVGRLAPEKNLEFLAAAVADALKTLPKAHFVVVGSGPSDEAIRSAFNERGIENQLHLAGQRSGDALIVAYRGFDLFAFASKSETQGMVLAEAMASGVPVLAIDAPGAREVVQTGVNGTLLEGEDLEAFAAEIRRFAGLPKQERETLSKNSEEQAQNFSQERCAEKALALYGQARRTKEAHHHADDQWEALLHRLETEYDLIASTARAVDPAESFPKLQIFAPIRTAWRWLRMRFNRSEFVVQRLGLPRASKDDEAPGLIVIQIDGLARKQFERALSRRRFPFVHRLLKRDGYAVTSFYSGLPSTTPAVQGELFYGKKCAVPSFAFIDRKTWRQRRSMEPEIAEQIERQLAEGARGALEGGSCYADMYMGGAAEAHFSPAAIGWRHLFASARRFDLAALALVYFPTFVRLLFLFLLESVIATIDSIIGIVRGQNVRAELIFIPARVSVAIMLREMITAGATIDIARGMPIIHLNFLGYDEHSHRRGPQSFFAHWTLKGIDRCIKRIATAAQRSTGRKYEIWIYSDHGQEQVRSYVEICGKTLQEAVSEVVKNLPISRRSKRVRGGNDSAQLLRARWLGGTHLQNFIPFPKLLPDPVDEPALAAGMGPLSHIYFKEKRSPAELERIAKRLVTDAHIPIALLPVSDPTCAKVLTANGEFKLPADAGLLFDEKLPYFDELSGDLCELLRHPDAGDIVILGWGKEPISFVLENGAHGGPGSNETHGFLCMPVRSRRKFGLSGSYVRPMELRDSILQYTGRSNETRPAIATGSPRRIRVMSYNVHSCLGTDGVRDVERIARVIAEYKPEIVCLQELDVGRRRSGNVDQAKEIARILQMHFHFHPALEVEEERYGNAILSVYPIHLQRTGALPRHPRGRRSERRGALWVSAEVHGHTFQFFNTHFGLSGLERDVQAREFTGANWLSDARCTNNVVVCGDFNSAPKSRIYRRLTAQFQDAAKHSGRKARATWHANYPVRRIDYIFASPHLRVTEILVPRTKLTKVASDHLPVVAEIEF